MAQSLLKGKCSVVNKNNWKILEFDGAGFLEKMSTKKQLALIFYTLNKSFHGSRQRCEELQGTPKLGRPWSNNIWWIESPKSWASVTLRRMKNCRTSFKAGSSGRGRVWGQNAADSKKPRKFHLNYRGILLESIMPHLGAKHPSRCETPKRNFVLKCNVSLSENKYVYFLVST